MNDDRHDAATPYWEAAAEERLALPRCRDCGRPFWYPRSICPSCGSERIEWFDASGAGRIHAWSVHHRAPAADFHLDPPYVVALVDLDEGVRIMSNVVGCEPDSILPGMVVRATWSPLDDGRNLLLFEPAGP